MKDDPTKQLTMEEYEELYGYKQKYDKGVQARREGTRKFWASLTPEERTARARKAAMARVERMKNKEDSKD